MWYLLEFLLEVVVHPGIEEWIVDGGAHSDDVSDEEREKKVAPTHHRTAVFLRHVQQIQRQPAHDEYRHHGDQHPVRAPLATNFKLHIYVVVRQHIRHKCTLINNRIDVYRYV